jgi:hypothetical protein
VAIIHANQDNPMPNKITRLQALIIGIHSEINAEKGIGRDAGAPATPALLDAAARAGVAAESEIPLERLLVQAEQALEEARASAPVDSVSNASAQPGPVAY